MRLTQLDTVDHANSNKIYQRLSPLHDDASSEEVSRRQLLREFCLGSIFDFFNTIGHEKSHAREAGIQPPSGLLPDM